MLLLVEIMKEKISPSGISKLWKLVKIEILIATPFSFLLWKSKDIEDKS